MAEVTSKKSNIRWDDALKLKLALATSKFRGYKQDDKKIKHPLRMEIKWERIRDHLLNDSTIDESFKSNPPSAKSLQTTFHRFLKEVLKAAGISEEGANLSGLEESPTEYQQLMIDIASEIDSVKETKKSEKEKEESKKKAILTHENDHLLKQRKIFTDLAALAPAKVSTNLSIEAGSDSENSNELDDNRDSDNDDIDDQESVGERQQMVTPRSSSIPVKANRNSATSTLTTGSSDSKKSKTGNSFMSMMIDLTRDDPKLIEAEIADKKQKREHEHEEHKQKMELQERQLAAEEKKVANEAKRLELEERRLAIMERENEIKKDEGALWKILLQQHLNK